MIALHGFLGRGSDFVGDGLTPDLFAPGSTLLPAGGFAVFCENFLAVAPKGERTLFGYSFGGRLALHLAMHDPDRWDRVILVSTSPGLLTANEKALRQANDDHWAENFLKLPWADVMQKWNSQEVFNGSQEPMRYEGDYSRELLARALKEYSWAQMQTSPERLKKLRNVHWVVGERDVKYMAMFAQLRESRVINNVHVLPGAGHRAIFDNFEGLAELMFVALRSMSFATWKVAKHPSSPSEN